MWAIVLMGDGVQYAGFALDAVITGLLQVNMVAKTTVLTEVGPEDPETGIRPTRTATYTYLANTVYLSKSLIASITPVSEADATAAQSNYPADKVSVEYGPWS